MNQQAPQKPTVNDLARAAGVSLATVDRVLNGRPGVRRATIEKVNAAIAEIGYVRDTAAANLARRRTYRLHFLLPVSDNEFVASVAENIARQGAQQRHERTTLAQSAVSAFDPQALADGLDALRPEEVDGVAVFGPETPSVRDAIKRARAKGIAVVAFISDLPSSERDHFVGIDNTAAGRTAASLMGRFVRAPGPVLVITGSRLARDHLERRQGFDTVIAEEFPGLDVVASVEGRDDPDRLAAMLPSLARSYPDLRGIYASGPLNAGLVRFLQTLPQSPAVIAHELTPTARHALKARLVDAIISQNVGHLVRSAIRLLKATADRAPFDQTQERIRIDIYTRENMQGE